MFDKVSRMAERAADGLSRRAFLSSLGRIGVGAMAFATFVGQAVAHHGGGDTYRWILNGSCCGGPFPWLKQRLDNGNWVNLGCAQTDGGVAYGCATSNCCRGAGMCVGHTNTCYSGTNCVTNPPC